MAARDAQLLAPHGRARTLPDMIVEPPQATRPDGRVRLPPRKPWARSLLPLSLAALLGAGLLAGGLAADSRALAVIAKLVLAGCAGSAIAVGTLELLERRVRPGRELCWCRVASGQRFSLSFFAHEARYHGIWLALDLSFPVAARSYRVVSSLHVVASGRVVFGDEVAVIWLLGGARQDDEGWASIASSARTREPGSSVLPSVLELDRVVELDHQALAPPGSGSSAGRFRALSLLCKLEGLVPGEQVEIHGNVQCPDFPTAMQAHALVAMAR
jgi:hypothetical protein